jgi:hypothetical protein
MIRFGTKTLLFMFILVALWCSTFSGYRSGSDVRASVLLIILLSAGFLAVYGRGRQRAFWAGFFVVMLLMGGNLFQGPVSKYTPNFFWRTQALPPMVTTYTAPPAVVYPQPVAPTASPGYRIPDRTPAMAPATSTVTFTPVTVNDYEFTMAVNDSIIAVWTLVVGSIVGLIGIWVYGSTRGREEQA